MLQFISKSKSFTSSRNIFARLRKGSVIFSTIKKTFLLNKLKHHPLKSPGLDPREDREGDGVGSKCRFKNCAKYQN